MGPSERSERPAAATALAAKKEEREAKLAAEAAALAAKKEEREASLGARAATSAEFSAASAEKAATNGRYLTLAMWLIAVTALCTALYMLRRTAG